MENFATGKALEKNIISEEIAELEEPIKNIIGKIKERIDRGEYGIIIGDDASGRIPALILGGFIKKISKLKNLREPDIIFIPGKLNELQNTMLEKKLQGHLSKHGVKEEDRVLIVTEVLQSGYALKVLSNLLKKLGFEVDIATIGIENLDRISYIERERKKSLENSNVISGDYVRKGFFGSSNTPLIYAKGRSINGVYKRSGDLRSRSVKTGMIFSNSQGHNSPAQEKINKSREEANILVDKLVEEYLAEGKAKI